MLSDDFKKHRSELDDIQLEQVLAELNQAIWEENQDVLEDANRQWKSKLKRDVINGLVRTDFEAMEIADGVILPRQEVIAFMKSLTVDEIISLRVDDDDKIMKALYSKYRRSKSFWESDWANQTL